jgi:hypothetical protein
MIDINFPSDPSKYTFTLLNDLGSIYLLARAVRHYGADNIDVVSPYTPIFYCYNSLQTIASLLGITKVRTVTLTSAKPDFPTIIHPEVANVTTKKKEVDTLLVATTLLRFAQKIEPEYIDLLEVDGGLATDSYGHFGRMALLSLLIDANIITNDLDPNTDGDYRTLVLDISQDTGNDILYTKFFAKSYPMWDQSFNGPQPEGPLWVPLQDYNIEDILIDAKEMGIIEPLLALHQCEVPAGQNPPDFVGSQEQKQIVTKLLNDASMCGTCGQCRTRRHLLLQADINDTTHYRYT